MEIPDRYGHVVDHAIFAAVARGAPGAYVPGIDVTGLADIWTQLIVDIAKLAGSPISQQQAKQIISQLERHLRYRQKRYQYQSKIVPFVPAFGKLPLLGINRTLNAVYTRRLAYMMIRLFEAQPNAYWHVRAAVPPLVVRLSATPAHREIHALADLLS